MPPTPEAIPVTATVHNILPAAEWLKVILTAGLGVIGGFAGKLLWDHYSSGRVEKTSVFVNHDDCQRYRERCGLESVKDKLVSVNTKLETFKAVTKAVQAQTEKRMQETSKEIAAMRTDISEIKDAQATSNTLLQILVDRQEREHKVKEEGKLASPHSV